MREFPTPEPITVAISMYSGQLFIVASDRADTVVHVSPGDRAAAADAKAAEQTEVNFAAGRLSVRVPEPHWLTGIIGRTSAVDVRIELPAGSDLHAEVVKTQIRAEGRLGEVRLDSVSGEVHLDRIGTLHAATVSGHLTVEAASGYADINGVSSRVRLRALRGSAVIKGVNGDVWIGDAGSDLHISTASGNIFVDEIGDGLTAKTSSGSIRIGRVTRGELELLTASGEVEVGISEGSMAWVDARSRTGSVRNSMQPKDGPAQPAEMVKVRARTWFGDIMIHRAATSASSSVQ
jgi:DUF4097 and DUF4098 domain-containing protein YvlB